MEVNLTILAALIILVVFILSVRTMIARAGSNKQKEQIDAEYAEKIKLLLGSNTQDTVNEIACHCTELEDLIDLYYRLFVIYVNQDVLKTHTLLTNAKLKKMELEFRDKYNNLLGTNVAIPPHHYKHLKQILRERKLMQ
jgi:hypothetical protein